MSSSEEEATLKVLQMFASTTIICYSFLLQHALTFFLSTSLSRIISDPSPLPRTRGLFTSRDPILPAQPRHPRHQIIPRTPVLSSPQRVGSQVHDSSTHPGRINGSSPTLASWSIPTQPCKITTAANHGSMFVTILEARPVAQQTQSRK